MRPSLEKTEPSKGKRKPSFWVFLAFYAFFGVFITVQSCLPSSASSEQSELIARIVAYFANLGDNGKTAEVIEPTKITLKDGKEGDSTYLPSVDGVPQVVVGTTTRLWFDVSYPYGKVGIEDDSFAVTATKGEGHFSYTLDAGNHVVRIIPSEPFAGAEISIVAGKLDPYVYKFDAVARPAPTDFSISLSKSDLKINETALITVGPTSESGQSMTNFLRYFDPESLDCSSSNSSVATIDRKGNVRALSEGGATLSVGGQTVSVSVAGSLPSSSGASISLSEATGSAHLLDYGESTSTHGATYKATISSLPSGADGSVFFSLADGDNGLRARIVEMGIGEDSLPYCVVQGYRKAGDYTIKASLRSAPDITASKTGSVTPLVASEMSLVYSKSTGNSQSFSALPSSLSVEKTTSVYLKGSFGVLTPTDSSLHVKSHDEGLLIYGDDTGFVTISFPSTGTYGVSLVSNSNPSLQADVTFTVTPANVTPDNTSFIVWVRKNIGHLGLFMCFGVFGILFWRSFFGGDFRKQWWKYLASALGAGFLLACLSEAIQAIPALERGSSWVDVGIDTAGSSIGAAITFLVFAVIFLVQLIKKKKEAPKDPDKPE